MPAVSHTSIPEQGQLVEVRQRRYVVTEVRQSTLPPDPLAAYDPTPQHRVTLASVEDDALGEELQVIWEIEPGTQAVEGAALPQPRGFDDPQRFDAFLDAVRWGAIASADLRALQAPFRSGITIEDYQLDPVVRAIQMPRANLLIADDVGLGKTIEAGLVVQELILRHRARAVLIVCPAALQIQWRDQMRDKFGLEFRIVDTELMRVLRRERGLHVNPWTHFPRLITSIDFLKRERPIRLFREVLPGPDEPAYPRRFDMLIVDEAHNVAPSGRGKYATDSLRTLAIRTIAPHFEHRLFLSATPHNGYPESFTALLELLDPQRFARGVAPERTSLLAVMVRRMKSELPPRWDGSPRFPARTLEAIEVAYTPEELRVHQVLRQYTQSRLKGASDQTEQVASEFVFKLLKKRLFSSPEAFARTLAQHTRSLETARKRGASPTRTPVGILRAQLEQADEEFGDDEAADTALDDTLDTATRLFRELTPEERTLLDELRAWAEAARGRPDQKTRELIGWLKAQLLTPDGQWTNTRVIIFTEYRDTQRWLLQMLTSAGLGGGERLMSLYGGMPTDQRERIKAAFQASPEVAPVRILLATDAASEGIDLQNHCSRLIHVEIPWNPNRMEQRNGRIDRHGQRAAQVQIFHFVSKGWRERQVRDTLAPNELAADLEFLMRAALKVNTIREDLGKVGPVIATQVEEAMLGRRVRLETAAAEREAEPVRRLLKFERQLREQIAKLHEQLQETRRDLKLEPTRVQTVVQIALALAGQPPLRATTINGLAAFQVPSLTGSWATCGAGLAHPHTGVPRPIVFDHTLVDGRDDVVLAHLNHRLVAMALRLLRAEVWAPGGRGKLYRVTARIVPNDALERPALIGHARLLVLGTDHQRLHEELIVAGGQLREGRFARINLTETQRVLAAATDRPVPAAVQERLAAQWPKHQDALLAALEARMRERAASLEKQLTERRDKEIADITAILGELQRAIATELDEPAISQLMLPDFSDTEREQLARNRDSLRARLAQIPGELAGETAAIRARYANPSPRLFPVAVTFLVPERLL
ncbi:DISARM system SNF2-like helicase DrmD [Candidatus Chloroploca sp. Khr17]|uniref:DISARM system SNF2-like helicase DrmD n=1 Tax=Candidatus Chloroploca sp. Khr17 TaxID=2496869 RepID=UPI00101C26E2|nr:DISARM system SNF2-like helicase DrmD [Candidatus Chloroploca sp. Khr17]